MGGNSDSLHGTLHSLLGPSQSLRVRVVKMGSVRML